MSVKRYNSTSGSWEIYAGYSPSDSISAISGVFSNSLIVYGTASIVGGITTASLISAASHVGLTGTTASFYGDGSKLINASVTGFAYFSGSSIAIGNNYALNNANSSLMAQGIFIGDGILNNPGFPSSDSGSFSVIIGQRTLDGNPSAFNAANSVIIGYGVARTSSTHDYSNSVLIGSRAAAAPLGPNNIAIGYSAMTAGNGINATYNIGIGTFALNNVDKTANTAIGHYSMFLTTAPYNTAVGASTLYNNTTGSSNVAIGASALFSNTVGINNTAVGHNTLAQQNGATGARNTAVGASAGFAVTTGSSNTLIGASAGIIITTGSNNTAIGYNAQPPAATSSNTFTMGNASVTLLRANVTTITALSDGRDKTDIEPFPQSLPIINSINPVRFTWDRRDGSMSGVKDYGFIAQELQQYQEESGNQWLGLVFDENPDKLEVTPGRLLYVAIKAIQELSQKNNELEERIAQLENK